MSSITIFSRDSLQLAGTRAPCEVLPLNHTTFRPFATRGLKATIGSKKLKHHVDLLLSLKLLVDMQSTIAQCTRNVDIQGFSDSPAEVGDVCFLV